MIRSLLSATAIITCLACSSMAMAFTTQNARETSGPVKHLGAPCLSFNILAGLVTVDPQTGNDLAVMANTHEERGELILVDLATNKGEMIQIPSGKGGWALQELSDHRIAYGTFYDGVVHIFDLKSRQWIKTIDVPDELYVWDFTMSLDGKRLYGGTYKGGKLISIDTETYELTDHGNGGPPNLYCRLIATLPDGRIYCNYRTEKPVKIIFDPVTDEFTTAPESMQDTRDGYLWNELFITQTKAFSAPDLELVEWPFRVKTEEGSVPATMNLDASSSGTMYLTARGKTYLQGEAGTSPTLITPADVKGVRPIGGRPDGTIVGVRGQQFYTIAPGQDELNLVPMPVDPQPRPMLFLEVDSGTGYVWGGPEFGQNVFMMNPANGETTNTQVVTGQGGEVYDMAFKDGIAYLASYSGGEVIRYDPDQPWDEVGGVNPKQVHTVQKEGYIRPSAGCTFGPDGKLYSGWWIGYGKYGGCICITDVETGEYRLIENPLGEQGVSGLDVDDKYAYVATAIHGNGLPVMRNKPPQFGMVDLESGEVLFRHEFIKYDETSTSQSVPLILEEMTGRVALSKDGQVKIFDPQTRQFVLEEKTAKVPGATTFVMASMHNGKVLFGAERDVVELDMTTGEYRVVASFDENPFAIAADPGGAAYVSVGVDVYEISLIPEGEDRE